MVNNAIRLFSALSAAALFVLPAARIDAAQYPERSLRLILPFPPGGGADTIARLLAKPLSDSLGQQIVVDNRGGGSTIIGAQLAAESTADGYTLFFTPNHLVINPIAFPKLPYDPVRDFTSVAGIGSSALVLVVSSKLEARSVGQLIALAKARPAVLNFASSGNYGPPHLAGELFKFMTKTDMVHIPYKGSGIALPALIGGQVQLMFATIPSVLPQVRAERLRALAVTGAKRSEEMPALPTIADTVPGYEVTVWYAIVAPAQTPPQVIKRLNADINRILMNAEFRQHMARNGTEPTPGTPEKLTQFLRAETKKWRAVLQNIKTSEN